MSIHLFKHNQEAYNSVTAMLEREKMAAVIHPTGTGKSLIAFKLAEEHPSEKFLWLSPSEYIYQTQLENLGMEFDNIQFMSYSRLLKNEDSIETLHPDYIILDEFHRCGAAEWGKSVRKLLTACPNAKRLGLSATNIRYLDNQRNMAEEIFDGKIASEMTLGEQKEQQTIILEGKNGDNYKVEILDQINYKNTNYYVVITCEKYENIDMHTPIVLMINGTYYETADSDVAKIVFAIFRDRHIDEYEFMERS